jgi:hypothetical protein
LLLASIREIGSPGVVTVPPPDTARGPLNVGSEKFDDGQAVGDELTVAEMSCTLIGTLRLFFTVKTMQRGVPG